MKNKARHYSLCKKKKPTLFDTLAAVITNYKGRFSKCPLCISRQTWMRRGRDECKHRSSSMCTEVQAACARVTKSVCVVTTSRYTNSWKWPVGKNPMMWDLAIVATIEPDPPVWSRGREMPYPANHVQENRNAPEPHDSKIKGRTLFLSVCHRGTLVRTSRKNTK